MTAPPFTIVGVDRYRLLEEFRPILVIHHSPPVPQAGAVKAQSARPQPAAMSSLAFATRKARARRRGSAEVRLPCRKGQTPGGGVQEHNRSVICTTQPD